MTTKSKVDTKIVQEPTEQIIVAAPNFQYARFRIKGEAPYVQNKFSKRKGDDILKGQTEPAKAKSRKAKEARDPEREYQEAMHITLGDKYGIPASAFRSAMIDACRLVGYQMTKGKMSVFIEPDDFDKEDGVPLVHLEGEPERNQGNVRLESGVLSIAIRPMWREWSATVTVRFDGDQFGAKDVLNLLLRAGMQVGIGEGRPFSRKSHGMGWGIFSVVEAY